MKTHVLCSITFSVKNCTTYEVMWRNIVEQGKPQMTKWCIACWIPKATNTRT